MDSKTIDKYYFEMFSRAGERECKNLIKKVLKKVSSLNRITKEDIVELVREGIKKVADNHREVYDTEPHGHIVDLTNNILNQYGYSFIIDRWETC